MTKSFKILSALLSYPSEELQAEAPALLSVLAQEGLLTEPRLKAVQKFVDDFTSRDVFDLQERYVLLFDRTRSLSLHLFEHVHGEGRDRGQAMVDLMEMYNRHGLDIDARELPDYLPMFLEFLSTLEFDEARDLLREPLHIVSGLKERLKKRKSPYRALFEALECIANERAKPADLKAFLETPEDDPEDLAALDAVWEEEAVTFGPAAGNDEGCPKAAEMLNRMMQDAPGGGKTTQQEELRHG